MADHNPQSEPHSSTAADGAQLFIAESSGSEGQVVDLRDKYHGPIRVAWRRFRKHRPGVAGLLILGMLYLLVAFADFFAPYNYDTETRSLQWAPPNLHFRDEQGFSVRPFVYPLRIHTDLETFKEVREEVTTQRLYIRFFVPGEAHPLFGLFNTTIRLFGAAPVTADQEADGYYSRIYLLGSDNAGRDLFSRLCYGSRISMTIGIIGTLFVLIIGLAVGGAMGYFGGRIDDLLYSFSQMVLLLPGFYLLLMLRFAFPANMDSQKVYFAIILILSLVGWPTFALVIRGMVKSISQESYIVAARAMGLSNTRIIMRHILPNTASYVIVTITLRIPGYILGESALSLLGLGIMEPKSSWGNMLQQAMNIVELNQHPWVLWPGVFIFLAVIAFNLVGDGLRDALDPKRLKI